MGDNITCQHSHVGHTRVICFSPIISLGGGDAMTVELEMWTWKCGLGSGRTGTESGFGNSMRAFSILTSFSPTDPKCVATREERGVEDVAKVEAARWCKGWGGAGRVSGEAQVGRPRDPPKLRSSPPWLTAMRTETASLYLASAMPEGEHLFADAIVHDESMAPDSSPPSSWLTPSTLSSNCNRGGQIWVLRHSRGRLVKAVVGI